MPASRLVFFAVFFFTCLAAQPVKLPVYGARKTIDGIRVDGKLDEFSWAASPRVQSFRLITDVDRRPAFPTEAAIVWDERNLYVAFACRDREPWSRMKRRDDHLWEEEVVEVFLDPDGDGLNYPELEVSPNNVVVDLLIPKPRAGASTAIRWDIAGLETAVVRHAAGWTAEVAIPWKSLAESGTSAAPKPGDQWRVGLYRIKRPGGPAKADQIAALLKAPKDKPGVADELKKLRSSDEYQAWSPTRPERGFHDPERFGVVEFLDVP